MSAAPTDLDNDRPGEVPSVPLPAGAALDDDAPYAEAERAAVSLRADGYTEAGAAEELGHRFPDLAPRTVAAACSAVFAYRDGDGRTQNDDKAARSLAPVLALRHRYVTTPGMPEGRWIVYDGARWRDDSARVALRRAIEAEARRLAESERDDDRALARRLSKESGKNTATRALERHLELRSHRLDRDPNIVALADVTAELRGPRRGRIREHRADDYVTSGLDLSYRPELIGSNIAWQAFGLSILDAASWSWLNLVLARWALHGEAPPFLIVLAGPTNAGKSTLAETVLAVLGDLGSVGTLAAFAEEVRPTPGPNSARAALIGPRFVSLSEAGRFDAIASPFFKRYTGGGSVSVQEKYGPERAARPTGLLMLDTNTLPRVDGADDAVMRRLRLVTFRRRFYRDDTEAERAAYDAAVERGESPGIIDPTLGERLKSRESREAILAWWIALLRDAPDADPTPPLAVQHATEAWRASANPVSAFIEGRFEYDTTGDVPLADFADELRAWLGEYLPERARDYRDNRQVSAAIRTLPGSLRIVTRAASKRSIVGLRRIESTS
jgi:phage/plasmid-associated DNA primase